MAQVLQVKAALDELILKEYEGPSEAVVVLQRPRIVHIQILVPGHVPLNITSSNSRGLVLQVSICGRLLPRDR